MMTEQPLAVLQATAAAARARVERIEAELRDPMLLASSPAAVRLRSELGKAKQELADARRALAVREATR